MKTPHLTNTFRATLLTACGLVTLVVNPNLNAEIRTIALQNDGKIWLGGDFSAINAQLGAPYCLARMTQDGVLETLDHRINQTWLGNTWGIHAGVVNVLAADSEGRILVGGDFNIIGGKTQNCLARLTSTGALELLGFGHSDPAAYSWHNWFNGVYALAPAGPCGAEATYELLPGNENTSDHYAMVGGSFSYQTTVYELPYGYPPNTWDRRSSANLCKILDGAPINSDGVDSHFQSISIGFDTGRIFEPFPHINGVAYRDAAITAIGTPPGGEYGVAPSYYIIGGLFNRIRSLEAVWNPSDPDLLYVPEWKDAPGLVKMDAVGDVDELFQFDPSLDGDRHYNCIIVLPDDRILLGGNSTTQSNQPCPPLVCLNEIGTIDPGFNPPSLGRHFAGPVKINAIARQADGKLLVGGDFHLANGLDHWCLMRLNADGSLDTSFSHDLLFLVYSILVLPDGKILVGGGGDGGGWGAVARLNQDGTLDPTFVANGGLKELQVWGGTHSTAPLTKISNGQTSPIPADGTDFGEVAFGGTSAKRAFFQLVGGGYAKLHLTGNPRVSIVGAHAGDFVIQQPLVDVIRPGHGFGIYATFTPQGLGLRTATVRIECDDLDANVFEFVIQGAGIDPELPQAVDTPDLTWSTGGGTSDLERGCGWALQDAVSHDGEDAAAVLVSPGPGHDYMVTTVAGPGTLKFWWKKEGDQSTLRCWNRNVDGDYVNDKGEELVVSAPFDWKLETVVLTQAGPAIIEFRLDRGTGPDTGAPDGAYVDQFIFTPALGVETLQATLITSNSALLRGTTSGAEAAAFEYGNTTGYGTTIPADGIPSGTQASAMIAGLTPGTTYHYRLVATNAGRTVAGEDRTFTTTHVGNNGAFSFRFDLDGGTEIHTAGTNVGATLEEDEVNPGGLGGASVWYQWTAPATGWVTIHTVAGSAANNLDTVIALYSGNGSGGLASLQMLGFNDESMRYPGNGYPGEGDYPAAMYPGGSGPSRLVFQATAGQVYQIAVHGSGAVAGPFELHIASEPTPGLRATALSATPSTVDVTGGAQPFTEQVTFESSAPLDLGDPMTMTDGTDSILIGYNNPDGSRGYGFELSLNDRISGTATNGTYDLLFNLSRYSLPGAWVLSAEGTFGGINFEWSPTGSDVIPDHYLIPPPVAGTLTVINTGPVDNTDGPELAAFNVSATTVNNSVADQYVTVTVTLTDDLSGVDPASGSVQLYNPIANSSLWASFADFQLISGTPQNGVYQGVIEVPVGAPFGTYYWDVNVSDLTGNNSEFSGLPPPYSGTTDPLLAAKTLTIVTGPVPEIEVTVNGVSQSEVFFGTVNNGSSGTPVLFTITNIGTASLTGLAVTKDGTHAGDFSVSTLGMATTLAAGGSTTFSVIFQPSAAGSRTAAIHIASNDADENPLDISLGGTGQAPSGGTSISEALDTPGLTWTYTPPGPSGSFPWTGQTAVTHDGADAVQTPTGHATPWSTFTQLTATVTGPGTLTFWWKKTGDAGQSHLFFDWSEISGFINHPHASRTDTFDWVQETVNITAAGQISLGFTFMIPVTDTGTPEVAYIDQVVFTPGGGGGFSGWNSTKFTPAELADPNISGPLADAEMDGILNAVEYALGLEPKTNNATPWQAGTQTVGPDQFQTIGFSVSQSSFPADATLIVEESDSLAPTATRTTLATKTGSAAWVASNGGVITQGAPGGGRIPITVRSPTAMGVANPSGFMRLRVQVP